MSGPGVVLLPELPGMSPEVMGLADHLVDAGFTVTVISLVGDPGRPLSPGYVARSFASVCVSREFGAFAKRADRPVAEYVRAVPDGCTTGWAGRASASSGCASPAASPWPRRRRSRSWHRSPASPARPCPLTASRRADIGMSDRERDVIRTRVQTEGLCLMGLRFSEDKVSPTDRFRSLRAVFGDGWLPVSISSRPGNPAGIGTNEHSVLTSKDVETPGHPTHEARAQVTAFLRERLGVTTAADA